MYVCVYVYVCIGVVYVYRYYVYNFYSCSSHIGLQRVTVAKTEYLTLS